MQGDFSKVNTTVDKEIVCLVKRADAVTLKAALTLLSAMLAGLDNLAALEVSNAILIAAGREPVSAEDVLAKMEEIRYGQAGG